MSARIIHIDYKHCYGRSNLIVVNSLNFVVNNFSTSRASSRIFYPSPSILYIHLLSKSIHISLSSWRIAILTESGPIITSLFVVGLSLFKINPLSTNHLFDHKVNHTYKVQYVLRSPWLKHFVVMGAMIVVAASGTNSDAALL